MKRLLHIIICTLISALAQANLKVHLEPETVKLGETFHLTIDDDNTRMQSVPNLTPLQEDFIILGTERSVNYSNINGQSSTVSQWMIMMQAKKAGQLIIPPIAVGLQKTEPLSILITGDASHSKTQDAAIVQKEIKLLTTADNENPYVNQQIIYTVKIYSSRRLIDTHYQPPEANNALLIPLNDNQTYQHEENGITYIVDEQHYAIFPHKSGILTIKPPVFTALTYDVRPRQITTENKPLQLKVQPVPLNIPNNTWLPVKSFTLLEDYDNTEKTLSQNSTLVRNISVEAVGVPGQFMQALPALRFEDKSQFNIYPEPAKEKSLVRNNDVIGKVDIKITYLLNKAGKITIPELRIPWFNTLTGKQEVAVLPPRPLDIKATVTNSSAAILPASKQTLTAAPLAIREEKQFSWAWILAGIFAIAWIITLGLWLIQKKGIGSQKGQYRKSLDALQRACIHAEPKETRDALLHWANLHWPDVNILNIQDLMPLIHDMTLKKQLHALSQILYGIEGNTSWSGKSLWFSISQLVKTKNNKKRSSSALPPMNLLGK